MFWGAEFFLKTEVYSFQSGHSIKQLCIVQEANLEKETISLP